MIETITSHLHMSTIITLNTLQLKKYSIVFFAQAHLTTQPSFEANKNVREKRKNRRIHLQRF